MGAFWKFARRMTRYPVELVSALILAFISAFSLGGGILALKPIFELILSDPTHRKGLPDIAQDMNERLARAHISWHIPDSWIAQMPAGPFTAAAWIFGGLAILTIIGGAANFGHMFLSLTVVNRTVANLRREVFHLALRQPLKEVISAGPSEAVGRIINDTGQLALGMQAMLSKALAEMTKGLAMLAVAFGVHWQLSLGAILATPLVGIIIRKLGKRIRRSSRTALEQQVALYRTAMESMQGLRVVKVHAAEAYEGARFHHANKRMLREFNRVRTARALASPLIEVVSVFVLGVLFLIAINFVVRGEIQASELLTTLGALGVAGGSIKPLSGFINEMQASAPAAERLTEMMSKPAEPGVGHRLAKLPRHERTIEFRDVTLQYPNTNTPAVRGVSLMLAHGRTVAFVGPNGSGKTSLLALVPRLYEPQSGSVLIDGQDIREFSVKSLRRQIGVVTQETVLFKGTVRGNIAYGAGWVSQEQVEAAARKARAHEFIMNMPKGYDTEVAEQGASLSGGQRQRIAIARAILRDPAILILDEATSQIDAESEKIIGEAISEFAHGRTCLVVAHRLSTVLAADHIVVLDKGQLVDQGNHKELMERCAVYRSIAQHQLLGGA